jgi:hypothetical protein
MLLTIFRDLRDNFAAEIWNSIGITGNSMIFTWSELPIAFVVLIVMSSLMLIRDNKKALLMNNYIILSGFVTIGMGTLALKMGIINPVAWMITLGIGTYLGYLPFNCLIFDRMIAASGSAANAGFLIYLADSFGYLGSVGTLLFKNFNNRDLSWINFLITSSTGISITGSLLIVLSLWYFSIKLKTANKQPLPILKLNTESIS